MRDNTNSGHRLRLKERYLKCGFDGFNRIEELELILYYAIPQKDVKPIARELMERFGSVANVFDASIDELCTVNGIGEHSAILLNMMPKLLKTYSEDKTEIKNIKEKSDEFYKLLVSDAKLEGENEAVWIYLFDAKEKLIQRALIHRGSVSSVSLDYRSVIEPAMRRKAASVVIMHNHPDGLPYPSTQDIETTREIYQIMSAIGVPMREHYIVAQNRIISIMQSSSIVTVE